MPISRPTRNCERPSATPRGAASTSSWCCQATPIRPAVFYLGRSYYTELLRAGVHIYERRGSVMHSKTASIDGVWSTIGSTNLDWRSFLHNDEINAVVLGRGFARQMEAMFAADLAESDAITLAQWKRRSLLQRLKEQMARLAAYWL